MLKRTVGFLLAFWAWPSFASIEVAQPQVRLMPPNVPNSAAYLTLISTGQQDALIGAECEGVEKTELHTLLHEEGLVKMRMINQINLPKDQSIALEQGGDHLMLVGLEQPLSEGQLVHCELRFTQAPPQSVAFTVVPIEATTDHHHHH